MAERNADSGELAVDELRRKARRRLVGAIVLALAAAVVVPMLLEDEPRPLGDDVSVQIPSRDQGKFVNRLTGVAPDAQSESKSAAVRDAKAPPPEREAVPAQSDGDTKPPSPAAPAVSSVVGAAEPQREADQADSKAAIDAKASAPSPSPSPSPAKAAPAQPVSGFVVQLAAFADDKGANALANKLKRASYAAYVEPVTTSRGTLWLVRVGGYASRPDADAARAKLKDEGYSGIVAPAR